MTIYIIYSFIHIYNYKTSKQTKENNSNKIKVNNGFQPRIFTQRSLLDRHKSGTADKDKLLAPTSF